MAMTSWNVSDVANLLIEAAHIALSFYDQRSASLKSDRSIVTEADERIEAQLAQRFDAPSAGVYLIGEETNEAQDEEYIQKALSGTTWIVDPIDGTSPYAHQIPAWGISIGLMQAGRLEEGAIFLPVTGEMTVTDGPTVLYAELGCNPEEWDTAKLAPLSYRRMDNPGRGIITVAQDVAKRGRFNGDYAVHALGSCVYAVIQLLKGAYSGYVANVKLWDIGAAIPLLRKVGFVMKFEDGVRFDGEVDGTTFELSREATRRWRVRTHLYVAPDEVTCDDIRAHTHL